MKIIVMKINLRANWVHSLKEKRMIVKSILAKIRNKFNVSIAEIDNQDVHQSIVIGISGIALDTKIADSLIEKIINFIDENCEAEIMQIESQVDVY